MLSYLFNKVPTKNAGELSYIVDKETQYGGNFVNINISGHVLLNQCGTFLKRKKYHIKGSSSHKFFLQMICVTISGLSIHVMYWEGILFLSINWNMVFDGFLIVGCIPDPLLIESISSFGFATIQSHVQSRFTNPYSSTRTDPKYCAHCYAILKKYQQTTNIIGLFWIGA